MIFWKKLPALAFSKRGMPESLSLSVFPAVWQQYPFHAGQGREGRGRSLLYRDAARWGEGRRPGADTSAVVAPVGARGHGSPMVGSPSPWWSTPPWRWPGGAVCQERGVGAGGGEATHGRGGPRETLVVRLRSGRKAWVSEPSCPTLTVKFTIWWAINYRYDKYLIYIIFLFEVLI